jgi:hypothetical protein
MLSADEAVIACRYHAELAEEIESLTSRILSRAEAGQAFGLLEVLRRRRFLLGRLGRLASRLFATYGRSRRRCVRGSTKIPSNLVTFTQRHEALLKALQQQDRRIRFLLESLHDSVQQDRLAVAYRRKAAGLYGTPPSRGPRYVSMMS